jgi:ATP-dependent 26S proteasome regulatory subunit
VERSVFRGQVLTLGPTDEAYRSGVGGISFHPRPQLTTDQIILPPGALPRIERHVVGVAAHREALLAAGQHLKRGVLLYGPPGTGKTHTVRYLLAQMTEVTTVLLSGVSLQFVGAAAELAVALQPALVVLEDVDLVAEHRDLESDAQPLLFTLMEAMDGLAGDADVAFLLTTNRADLLEPALAQRPGRVDLAVEIPLPDRPARVALLRLYARGLPLTWDALDTAADRTEGITASFVKELLRRTTLLAIEEGRSVTDADLIAALDELHHDREALTRSLLGSPAKVR